MQIISRRDALLLKLPRYFTGHPCKHGHVAARRTPSGTCIECEPISARDWRSKNKDKARTSYRKWAINKRAQWEEKNKEKLRLYQLQWNRAWRAKNREKANEKTRRCAAKHPETKQKWKAANRERIVAYEQNRRAAKRRVGGRFTVDDIARIRRQQRNRCAEPTCRKKLNRTAENIDHIIPLAKGGSNWPSNLQLLCQDCNLAKAARDPITHAQQKGRLL
jgi:5-methylcytosine-specific restriction endonuclease McrA